MPWAARIRHDLTGSQSGCHTPRSGSAGPKLKLHLVPAFGGRGFGLQAEVFFFRAFGSIHGGLEATPTSPEPMFLSRIRPAPA